MKGLKNPELSKQEAGILKNLEKITDSNIKERFDGTNSIYIDSTLIDNALSDLSGTRLAMVRERWIQMYEKEGGWKIRFSSDRDGGTYIVEPKGNRS